LGVRHEQFQQRMLYTFAAIFYKLKNLIYRVNRKGLVIRLHLPQFSFFHGF
jgi:hypothetical protein